MKSHIPLSELKSVTEFPTDAAHQAWSKKLLERHGLDDGYCYSVSLATGKVTRGRKMNLPVKKISKSDQET